jgi:tRNA A37 threonylcarbamoyladenosine dehydratase
VYSRWAATRMDPLAADLREKLRHEQIMEKEVDG